MSIETQLIIAACALGIVSLMVTAMTLLQLRKHQNDGDLSARRVEYLEETLLETKELLEESRQIVSDHARRIAWLDAKIRQSRFLSLAGQGSSQSKKPRKSSIDEQRGRVLKLSKTGQQPHTIAASLGMMPGEVELILNLSNHNATAA